METTMVYDLKNETAQIFDNFKGGQKSLKAKMHFDGVNRILHGVLESGATIGIHTHETNSEIIYILNGSGKVLFDGKYESVSQGMCHYCPKGHSHSLINDSDSELEFFAVVPEQ